jgi:Rab GDP dissociation inhibitor
MRAIFEYFGLDEGTTDFIGHALALQQTEDYLGMAAYPTVMAIKMYAESMARFGGDSPYIYPLYGLGELPQAFARLSAVYGGTYMLNKPGCEVVYDEESGRACGVRSEGETAKAPIIVGDPSYFRDKCRLTQKVIRAMCIMSHPIPNTGDGAEWGGAKRRNATRGCKNALHAC